MAYRVSDADELVNIDNRGRLEVERGGCHCSRDARRSDHRDHRLGGGLVLGRARHDGCEIGGGFGGFRIVG